METSLQSGRDALFGIARFAREQRDKWSIYCEASGVRDSLPAWLKKWRGHGIIARVENREISEKFKRLGVPVVNILGDYHHEDIPHVLADNQSIGRLAAEHLIERGYRNFAFCGLKGIKWSESRYMSFLKRVKESGCGCPHFYAVPPYGRQPWYSISQSPWEAAEDMLAKWLKKLPRPVGLMVCSDLRGQFVIEACRRAGIMVPEQIAVIGADNDEPICELCNPPLSSVIPNHEQVGYQGAALLMRMMKGESLSSAMVVKVQPRGVSLRQSTDVLAMDDFAVADALRYIREYAIEGIGVQDVVSHVRMSRSVLQRKFRHGLNRSIYDEIMQVRITYAQRLLAESDLSIGLVAEKSGFGSQEYMTDVFRRKLGQPPARYRKSHRPY
ncbi:MAG: hypothetical protein A2283_09580 [Lentisphaerae bacterium RIFOXYA12_FULL_48_11]|nr:MAG: hypothetical protein A2283_09580 [Lentisphaerae bacterium RIFOXYA12_FULL_48_11]